jgi:D-glycero-D-manno-heptose 1,7-bisphosphate phosphatase
MALARSSVEDMRHSTTNREYQHVPAIFLDRDGVINRERADYVKIWDEFEFLPGVLPALGQLATLPVPILIISNQSAIGRGLVQAETVAEIHRRAQASIQVAGGRIDDFFVCPHQPTDGCACRKPKPGLLQQAVDTYALDIHRSIFVGDAITDFQAAQAIGCRSILVESGRQGGRLRGLVGENLSAIIVADLAEAATLILEEYKKTWLKTRKQNRADT